MGSLLPDASVNACTSFGVRNLNFTAQLSSRQRCNPYSNAIDGDVRLLQMRTEIGLDCTTGGRLKGFGWKLTGRGDETISWYQVEKKRSRPTYRW